MDTTALRPLTVGELLDRTFSLYRKNFILFAGISAIPPALSTLASVVFESSGSLLRSYGGELPESTYIIGAVVLLMIVGLYIAGYAVAQAAAVYAVSNVHLGRATSISESFARVKGKYARIIRLVVTIWVRVFGAALAIILLAMTPLLLLIGNNQNMGLAAVAGLGMGVGFLAAMGLSVYLFIRYAVAVPACVLEDIGASDALKRSATLIKGFFGRVFLVYVCFVVMIYVVMIVVALPIQISAVAIAKDSPIAALILNALVSFVAGVLVSPILTIGLALTYYDLRIRKEAFDIQLMMAALDGPKPDPNFSSASAG